MPVQQLQAKNQDRLEGAILVNMKSKKQLGHEIVFLALTWFTMSILVALRFGLFPLLVFIIGSVISWYAGVACLAYGFAKDDK